MAARLRFVVALLAFLAWIGYLAALVARTRDPIVPSRPQILAAQVVVSAELTGAARPESEILVRETLWSARAADAPKVGSKIQVGNLFLSGPEAGYRGPGVYLVPLVRTEQDGFLVPAIPPSPGYAVEDRLDRHRVYHDRPAVRSFLQSQLESRGREP